MSDPLTVAAAQLRAPSDVDDERVGTVVDPAVLIG